ncbi:MAG: alpha-isopropylmalate synthase regulatory domain-containing protein, partial [Candidatus Thiodiazotropha sp. 6PDIVS]
ANIVQGESEQHLGEVSSETIHTLFQQHFVAGQGPYRLTSYRIDHRSGEENIEAEVMHGAKAITIKGQGKGAISAFIDALSNAEGLPIQVIDYVEHAIDEGADAEAAAYVLMSYMGQRTAGAAISRDTVNASLNAVLSALNFAISERRAA